MDGRRGGEKEKEEERENEEQTTQAANKSVGRTTNEFPVKIAFRNIDPAQNGTPSMLLATHYTLHTAHTHRHSVADTHACL